MVPRNCIHNALGSEIINNTFSSERDGGIWPWLSGLWLSFSQSGGCKPVEASQRRRCGHYHKIDDERTNSLRPVGALENIL